MLKLVVNILIAGLVLYNTYKGFKARKIDRGLRIQYSHYFKIMCLFLVFDNIFATFLRFVPFYQVGRLLMVVWLSIPSCSGAAFVYRFYVNGFLKVYEQDLDQYVLTLKEKIINKFLYYYNYANTRFKESKNRKKVQDASLVEKTLAKDLTSTVEKLEMGIMGKPSISVEQSKLQEENEDQNSSMDDLSNVSNEGIMTSELKINN